MHSYRPTERGYIVGFEFPGLVSQEGPQMNFRTIKTFQSEELPLTMRPSSMVALSRRTSPSNGTRCSHNSRRGEDGEGSPSGGSRFAAC